MTSENDSTMSPRLGKICEDVQRQSEPFENYQNCGSRELIALYMPKLLNNT